MSTQTCTARHSGTIVQILRGYARSHPSRVAFHIAQPSLEGETTLTYQELDERAGSIASAIRDRGAAGERVLLALSPGTDFVAALFGCFYAGAIAVPAFDPEDVRSDINLESRLLPLLNDSSANLILTHSNTIARFRRVLDRDEAMLLAADSISANAIVAPSADNNGVAILQYTSGSTAEPRGVPLTHANLIANLKAIQSCFELGPESIGVIWLPPYHDMGLIGGILQPVFAGFPTVILRPASFLRDPLLWLRAISQYRATISGGPDFAYEYCSRRIDPADAAGLDLTCWKVAFNGSEPLRAETLDRFSSIFATAGFNRRAFCCCYGLAEATLMVSAGHVDMEPVVSAVDAAALATGTAKAPQDGEAKVIVSSGSVIPSHDLRIVSGDGSPCPDGQVGEICVAGPSCASSYWKSDGKNHLTLTVISENGSRKTFLRTGDLGFVQCGQMYVTGRMKDVVIINGENVYPQDIEAAVEAHLADLPLGPVVCIAGDEPNRVIVLAELKAKKNVTSAALVEEVAARIREVILTHCRVPLDSVVLLRSGSIRGTRSGKLQRHACREAFRQKKLHHLYVWKSSQPGASVIARNHANELVNRLCTLAANAIGAPEIMPTTIFFEAGMHSLSAAAFVASIRAVCGVDVSLQAVFEQPTPEKLASVIQRLLAAGTTSPAHDWSRHQVYGRSKARRFPLNDVQHAYWIGRSSFYELGNVGTHVYTEYDCPGLDVARFQEAWQMLVKRHDMLRAIVRPDGEQEILENVPDYKIRILDLSAMPDQQREASLLRVREEMSHQLLDTASWPLWELRASLLENGVVRLHCSLDLLIADLWSTQILFRELALVYDNPSAALPRLEIGFREYVLAEREFQLSELFRRAERYWTERASTLAPAPQLPLAKNSNEIKEPIFVRRRHRLERGLWSELKRRAARAGLTPSGSLLAAYAEVLASWSKSSQFTINLTLFNRLPVHPQVESIVGDFTTLTLLSIDSSQSTFVGRARAIQQQLWLDLEARYFSGVRVMRLLAKNRGITEMPVVFTSSLVHGESTAFPFGRQVFGISQTPQIWLDHQVFEEDGALVFNWDAVEEMFPPGCLDQMFASYGRLLHQLATSGRAWLAVEHPAMPVEQGARRKQVNATDAPVSDELLQELFVASARRFPESVAVSWKDGSICYGELLSLAARTGHALRKLGTARNQLVAIIMKKGWEQVAASLGVLFSGAAYLPIEPSLPVARQAYLLENSGARLALTNCDLPDSLASGGTQVISLTRNSFPDESCEPPESVQGTYDLAYVMYTSGSTGSPKGVMIDHCGAVNTIRDINSRFQVGPDDAVLALSAFNFDLSVYDVFGLLAAGGKIVFPHSDFALEPGHWCELLSREKVTIWNTVPALKEMLVDYLSGIAGREHSDWMRLVMLSGDWIPLTLPGRIKEIFPGARLVSLGGATEAAIWSILFEFAEVDPAWKSVPYGKPMINQQFEVLNEHLEDCPDRTVGELYIGGTGLARGYWNDDQKTRARFFRHPRTGVRLYKTGDLGRYLPDGNIEFLGREDFQVKIHGHRIELGEIETALQVLPGIQQAVVVAPGARNHRRLVSWVKPSGDLSPLMKATEEPRWAESTWNAALRAGHAAAASAVQPVDSDLWSRLMEQVDRWTGSVTANALAELGLFRTERESCSLEDALCRAGIVPRYRKWLKRALSMLVEDRMLVAEGLLYRCEKPLRQTDSEGPWKELLMRLREHGLAIEGLEFARRSAENLPAILRGEDPALSSLFVNGQIESAASMYQAEFDYCNRIFAAVARAIGAAWPQDRPLRVLEIGAGVGSTTRHLLPALQPPPAQYVFTDISKFFLNAASSTFGEFAFLEFRLLDIENDPVLNGFEPHGFDIIVAASVLHATRNIHESVSNMMSLLSPGGTLLLLEETRFPRVFNLTMGLQQGFDLFADSHVRKEHPLISCEDWRRILGDHGCVAVESIGDERSSAARLGLHAIAARNASRIATLDEQKMREALAGSLPDYMCPSEFIVVENLPLSANGKVDRGKLASLAEGRKAAQKEYVAPSTAIEKTTAEVIAQVLAVERVGLEDNFFELGGDSLLATQLIARLRDSFEVEIPLSLVFQNRTIAELVTGIEQIRAKAQSPVLEILEARGQ